MQANNSTQQLCRAGLAGLLLLPLAFAAQAQERRRAGPSVDRHSDVQLPTPAATPKPQVQTPAAPVVTIDRRRPGEAAARPDDAPVQRPRRPGDAPVAAAVEAVKDAVQDAVGEAAPRIGESGRRRPGQPVYTRPDATGERVTPGAPSRGNRLPFLFNQRSGLQPVAKPGADAQYRKEVVADRWQLTRALGLTDFPWYDPYNQNTLKADRPVLGQHWFFNLSGISDTVVEPRRLPTPVAPQAENSGGQLDVIGKGDQLILSHNLAVPLVLYKGNTTFMPPEWEFRFTPVFNVNRVSARQNRALYVDPTRGDTRTDQHIGVQDLFVDKHLWNWGTRYDFDSLRIGIQPFTADFRGFLFRDEQLGARLFGNRDNNIFQYNLAWFRRLEKDTNSGLNDLGKPLRADDVFVANLYWQDFPVLGMTSEAVLLYNRNREGNEGSYFNNNGFIERPASLGLEKPRNYNAYYAGLNGEGHFGRLNFSGTSYFLFGDQDRGVFVDRATDLRAFMVATELGFDFDWRRVRLTALYASGDKDPFDDVETGFDSVFENVLFAGADTSFWVRQNVPFIGGGGVALSGRNGIFNTLRSSKEEGQSNFTNPGTVIVGLGADFDLTAQWRVSTNVNQVMFAETAVIEAARQQGGVSRTLGTDLSVAAIWRPFFTQNIVLRASGAVLLPGAGYKALYGDDELPYSILLNLTLTW
ncbi:hypothetical protein [Sinimarinibacterium sp. NLF-5-8]|uniref:hypothetical protein n=1 Tax=Sinimarinibacterium sp. NLF-5-8 TaxID=2698684 RepID=UPI00137BF46E|nr:hypothetical protein [Sinimarinibacterium sp. NLF-5-8]QHS11207.1 hypothetical protein GT972_14345 [Sinimarinibacterium sp. NLF-5-8]